MKISGLIKQKEYERVVYVLRRHPITFLPILGMFVLLALVPLGIYFLITSLYPLFITSMVTKTIFFLFGSVYYFSILLLFYTQFVEFYLDLWIVTNDRIVDIEQLSLFARTISELDLFRIQDVTTNVTGVFATIFKYGDVEIKTASRNVNIVFRKVKYPNVIRETLIELSDADRRYHYQQQRIEETENSPQA